MLALEEKPCPYGALFQMLITRRLSFTEQKRERRYAVVSPQNLHFPQKRSLQLLADTQLCNECTIALNVFLCKIVEHAAALTDELIHTETAVVVIGMLLQVLGELTDTLGPDSDLNFGRPRVVRMGGIAADDFCLFLFGDHVFSLSLFLLDPVPRQRAERHPHQRLSPQLRITGVLGYITIRSS